MSRSSTEGPEQKWIWHEGSTLFIDRSYDTGEGWIGPIKDAEDGNPLMLLLMLFKAP